MSRITEKTKLKEKRGTGTGADYKPWILAREIGSLGTESVFKDWKHGRNIQCLSQAEVKAYTLLRWRDDVLDIREQYPLDLKVTLAIARRMGLPHPHSYETHMATDFLVTYKHPNGGSFLKAYSVKPNETHMTDYALKNLAIEQAYWGIKGVCLEVIYADNLNNTLITNIRQCVQYYNGKLVKTNIDLVKHLIARKKFLVDMETKPLDFTAILQDFLEENKFLNL